MALTQYKDGIKFAEGRKILIITVQPIEVFDKLSETALFRGIGESSKIELLVNSVILNNPKIMELLPVLTSG